jgi:hypothetical protein
LAEGSVMNRRTFAGAATAAGLLMANPQGGTMSVFHPLFEQSMNEKKGLTVYVNGQSVVGVVTRINGAETVEMRSREVSRILVRIDRIDAVSIS